MGVGPHGIRRGGVAWLLVQVAGTVLPWFAVSASVLRGLVLVLAIGFVPVLVLAWVFELTPGGLKRDAYVAPGESIAPRTAQRMNRAIISPRRTCTKRTPR